MKNQEWFFAYVNTKYMRINIGASACSRERKPLKYTWKQWRAGIHDKERHTSVPRKTCRLRTSAAGVCGCLSCNVHSRANETATDWVKSIGETCAPHSTCALSFTLNGTLPSFEGLGIGFLGIISSELVEWISGAGWHGISVLSRVQGERNYGITHWSTTFFL